MRPYRIPVVASIAIATVEAMFWVPVTLAQPRPNPADPSAPVPAAIYRSAFGGYRPLGEEAVGNWRSANDQVGRIGGWREYARESEGAGASSKTEGASREKPGSDPTPNPGHEGHVMPGKRP